MAPEGRSRGKVSSINRLKALPAIFTLDNAAAEIGCDTVTASVYIHRWRSLGIIEPVGERAGIYFNLLQDPVGPQNRAGEALRMIYPGAVLRGRSALQGAGWIKDAPATTEPVEVAVLSRRSYLSVTGFEIEGRSASWFAAMDPYILQRPSCESKGLRSLGPAAALADMVMKGADVPKAEDMDLRTLDWLSVKDVFLALGAEPPADFKSHIDECAAIRRPPRKGLAMSGI